MSTLIDVPLSATYQEGDVIITFESRAELRFPVNENPRLAKGTAEQLSNMELSPFGVHWPDLDEDLSFNGIAEGNYGQRIRYRKEIDE